MTLLADRKPYSDSQMGTRQLREGAGSQPTTPEQCPPEIEIKFSEVWFPIDPSLRLRPLQPLDSMVGWILRQETWHSVLYGLKLS